MITALLVDDSEFMRELLKTIISKHQIQVIGEADNGQTGVEKYKELKPDIVFLDVMMDDMDGVEALRQIVAFDPKAKAVMVSSMMTQKPFIDDVMKNGAKAVINKPFDSKEVGDVLASVYSMISADLLEK